MHTIPRPEYPRPQFFRPSWMNLNGNWQFEIDHGASGRARGLVEKELSGSILVPFCPESPLSGVNHKDFMEAVSEWKEAGYPAVHHSEEFREMYHPAYRVVAEQYVKFLPLFCEIDRGLGVQRQVVAIEGGSASGKTTLSQMLESVYDCTVFHMDDFFLRPEQRTPERFSEPGGNVDRERFLEEVLKPLSQGEVVRYRRFDCSTFTLGEPVGVELKPLIIVEGAYSMHPELADHYDLSVFLDVSPELQRERIAKRNTPELAKRFHEEWIPMEQLYFSKMGVKERCDLVIPAGK